MEKTNERYCFSEHSAIVKTATFEHTPCFNLLICMNTCNELKMLQWILKHNMVELIKQLLFQRVV